MSTSTYITTYSATTTSPASSSSLLPSSITFNSTDGAEITASAGYSSYYGYPNTSYVVYSSVSSSGPASSSSGLPVVSSSSVEPAPADAGRAPRVGPSQYWMNIIIGVSCAIGVILVVLITWCCIRRRRRRAKQQPSLGQMDQVGSSMVLPGRRFGGDLTHADVQSAVVLGSLSSESTPPRLPPRPYQPTPALAPSTRWGSDDSEYDMIATDGSSIARTLSSGSVDTITNREPMSMIAENPFDHPAYTVRPRRDGPSGTGTNTYSSASPITPLSGSGGTWLHPSQTQWSSSSSRSPNRPRISTTQNTFTSSQPSPIQYSPASQSSLSRYTPSPAPTYSTSHPSASNSYPSASASDHRPISIISESTDRSEEDDLGAVTSTPGLRRGTTFIQHTDSLSPTGQPSVAAWRDGRRRKEIHLPPSYGEVYGDLP